MSAAKKGGQRAPARSGRPKELVGEVDQRILDAAGPVFLERGFGRASIEEIAEVARSGKPTIYARFPNKGALFTTMVMRSVLGRIEQFKAEVPSGPTVKKRPCEPGAGPIAMGLGQQPRQVDAAGHQRIAPIS